MRSAFLLIILMVVVFVGGMITTRVVKQDYSIDKVKLIFDTPSIKDNIDRHQKDARYFPYRARKLLFNNSVYVFQILRNIANFWNLENINKTILLGNLYPIIVGFGVLIRKKEKWWLWLTGLVSGSFVIGINKMVDARSAMWMMLPIFGYLLYVGINQINKRIYGILLIISLVLLA